MFFLALASGRFQGHNSTSRAIVLATEARILHFRNGLADSLPNRTFLALNLPFKVNGQNIRRHALCTYHRSHHRACRSTSPIGKRPPP